MNAKSLTWSSRTVAESVTTPRLSGKTKIKTRDCKPSGRFPVIDQGQSTIAGWTDDESAVISEGLPLIVFGDHTRAVKYIDFPFARGADGTQVLSPVEGLDPLFIYYALRAVDLPSRGYNRHFTLFKEQVVSVPDSRAAQISLGRALQYVDSMLTLQVRLLDAVGRLQAASLRHCFGDRVNARAVDYTCSAGVPQDWPLVPLSDIAKARGGASFPPRLQGRSSGEIPFYKVSDMNSPGNERNMSSSAHWISRSDAVSLKAHTFPASTIVFPKVGGALHTNKKRVLMRESLVDNNIMGLTVIDSSRCSPTYLFNWFSSINLSDLANPGPLPSINASHLNELLVPVPPMSDQEQINAIFGDIDRKAEIHRRKRQIAEDVLQHLLHRLSQADLPPSALDLTALPSPVEAWA